MTEEIKDTKICSIDFVYDGLTEHAKMVIKNENFSRIDSLNLYAHAAIEILEKYSEEVSQLAAEYLGDHPYQSVLIH